MNAKRTHRYCSTGKSTSSGRHHSAKFISLNQPSLLVTYVMWHKHTYLLSNKPRLYRRDAEGPERVRAGCRTYLLRGCLTIQTCVKCVIIIGKLWAIYRCTHSDNYGASSFPPPSSPSPALNCPFLSLFLSVCSVCLNLLLHLLDNNGTPARLRLVPLWC